MAQDVTIVHFSFSLGKLSIFGLRTSISVVHIFALTIVFFLIEVKNPTAAMKVLFQQIKKERINPIESVPRTIHVTHPSTVAAGNMGLRRDAHAGTGEQSQRFRHSEIWFRLKFYWVRYVLLCTLLMNEFFVSS